MQFDNKTVLKTARPCNPIMVNLECICGGIYKSANTKVYDKILHICDKCGDKIYTYQEYPHIEYETFGDNPIYSGNGIVFIEDNKKEEINEI